MAENFGILCPACAGETSVIDSRPHTNGIRRRRARDQCGERFTTFEIAVDEKFGTAVLATAEELGDYLARIEAAVTDARLAVESVIRISDLAANYRKAGLRER